MSTLQDVSTHHWLKHRHQNVFHVYLSRTRGTESLCKNLSPIGDLNAMDIPGDHSPCCVECFRELYGFDPDVDPREL